MPYYLMADDAERLNHALDVGVDPNIKMPSGVSALIYAVRNGSAQTLHVLLKHGANVNIQDDDGNTALMNLPALHTPDAFSNERLNLLFAAGADTHIRNYRRETPIQVSIRYNNKICLAALIEHGVNSNAPYPDGRYPLYHAVQASEPSIVSLLLKHGADPNQVSRSGKSPLHLACLKGEKELVFLLLGAGANVNIQDKDRDTPLLASCNESLVPRRLPEQQQNRIDIAAALLKHGAKVNVRDADNRTPLIAAIERQYDALVPLLLKHGANVNQQQDISGMTPLMTAAQKYNDTVIRLLLKHGARVNVKDVKGQTALDYAWRDENDTATLLKKAGARHSSGWKPPIKKP